jgi:glycosyltransferase involved in cell wall biosynthesis
MKISIIAPCLNEERYVGKFLGSIAHQQGESAQREVVIVNGGSSDRSLKIIDEWRQRVPFDILVINEQIHNIGYVRNLGGKYSTGDILFHTNADAYFHDSHLLEKVASFYKDHNIFAVSGATYELECCKRTRLTYEAYHLARWLFSNAPFPVKRYSPSANFLSIRRDVFELLGGFPSKYVNEDGFFGREMLQYAKSTGRRMVFLMKVRVSHHPVRFNSMGWRRAMQYYFYVLPNIFPFLDNCLGNVHEQSAQVFKRRLYKR